MTRINVGIHPRELPSKLLLAEHREITRIPNAVKTGRAILIDIPPNFTLGAGHVKFFYNKLGYLKDRYAALYYECVARGFQVTDKGDSFDGIDKDLLGQYQETSFDRQLLIERITSKGFQLILEKIVENRNF